jgi:protein-L-isoaspartate(D-aspartate) O-methyltransferase
MNDVEKMMADIDSEVFYTRKMIGRESLDSRVMEAMRAVPRDKFVPDELKARAFDNGPLPIGHQQTISQPYIVALMSDLLNPDENDVILEIGTGSGYQTAILSCLVKQVYSMEFIKELCESASTRLKQLGYHNVKTCTGNGHKGWPEHAPYDGIIVTAAATHIPPALVEQLKPGGRLVIPVGMSGFHQELMLVEKDQGGETQVKSVLGVAFVPLVGGEQDG